ncbi:epoxide hydrolase family protein [Nocardia sp. NPDC003482]
MSTEIRPFRIEIPRADLDDLHDRLIRTRWSRSLPGDGRGVPVAEVRAWAEYWATEFDWAAQQDRLNRFPQYLTEIDGLDVHFLHVRSADPAALPLILDHGWPNSFVEFADVIEPLAETFHVVVPSVPGFGFSAAPRGGCTVERVARMWHELMARLGYGRYGVQGGDLGAYVATALAETAPDRVAGLYVTAGLGFPTPEDVPDLSPSERAAHDAMMSADWVHGVDHHALLRSAPQTFAYGWDDSPAAALAWMLQKFGDFGGLGGIARDALLTNLSVYWFTRTFATSSWPYYETTEFRWPTGSSTVPTGVYSGAPGIRRLAERTAHIVHWPTTNPPGHHFITMDQPTAYAADLRAFFAERH